MKDPELLKAHCTAAQSGWDRAREAVERCPGPLTHSYMSEQLDENIATSVQGDLESLFSDGHTRRNIGLRETQARTFAYSLQIFQRTKDERAGPACVTLT